MLANFPTVSLPCVVFANAACAVMAWALNWELNGLLTLYWLELIAIGFITLRQMRRASRAGTLAKSRGYLAIFFIAHYSTFCVIYRAALVYLLSGQLVNAPAYWIVVWLPLAALIGAHVVSYRRDYLPREAAGRSPFDAMWIPYLRELPLQVPMLVALTFVPDGHRAGTAVLLFGAGKTMADAVAHVLYHSRIVPIAAHGDRAGRENLG
jgi:hypothetical protein